MKNMGYDVTPITIITTYYNNREFLESFIEDFKKINLIYPELKLLVIDDGSKEHPASSFCEAFEGFNLYTITEDIGFNSHGARNLGVEISTTHWNLLIDVDYDLSSVRFDILTELDFSEDTVYMLDVNAFLTNKTVYMSCHGYDEEFYNMHFGDRIFTSYIKRKFKTVYPLPRAPRVKRGKWKVIRSEDVDITTYEGNVMKHPAHVDKRKFAVTDMVRERYKTENFDSKPILNFRWEKTF